MTDRFDVLSARERGIEIHRADFNEVLYESLRSAPWWLASIGAHAVVFLGLSLFGGASAAAGETAVIQGSILQEAIALEPEIEIPPDVLVTPPLEEDEKVVPQPDEEESRVEDEAEADPREVHEVPGDPRLNSDDSPFEGPAVHGAEIGVGGPPGGLYGGRKAHHRNIRSFGDGSTEDATVAGLEWLKNHQSPGGFWDTDGFEAMCRKNRCGGPGGALYDPGNTGLALLAFLGYGETHKTPRYGNVVRNGLKYLKGIQDAEGCFGPRTSGHFTYNHAIGALAMAEAYGLTLSPLFKASAQNGINFVAQCRNPYLAWRYGVKPQDNDTSVTGWMVMALKSAAGSGLDVDPECFDGARAWMDKVTEPEYGRAGYTARGNGPSRPQELMDRFPAEKSESLTAVAVLTRIFSGAGRDDEHVRKGADLMLKCLPVHDEAAGTVDHYYWYYGTLAMFQVGGEHWKKWEGAMVKAIAGTQRSDGADDRRGSWDPLDPWAADGGRVYSTAVNTMSLEVYYRLGRVFGTATK